MAGESVTFESRLKKLFEADHEGDDVNREGFTWMLVFTSLDSVL